MSSFLPDVTAIKVVYTWTSAWAGLLPIELVGTDAPGSGNGAGIRLRSAKPTASGHRLAMIFFGALDSGATIQNSAAIQAYATEDWGAIGGEGTELTFEVTANAAFARMVALRLSSVVATFSVPVKPLVTTVAALPAAATVGAGARAHVADALAPTFGATVVAGGAVSIPVCSDGAAWKVG